MVVVARVRRSKEPAPCDGNVADVTRRRSSARLDTLTSSPSPGRRLARRPSHSDTHPRLPSPVLVHMLRPRSVSLATLLATLFASPLAAQTRMLRSPTVSDKNIAFAYANNIWIVDRAGGA